MGNQNRCGKGHCHRRLVGAGVVAKKVLVGNTTAGCRAPCDSLVYIFVPQPFFRGTITQSRTNKEEMDMKSSEIDTQPATAVLNNITRSKTARIKEIVNGVVFGTWHRHLQNLILLSKCFFNANFARTEHRLCHLYLTIGGVPRVRAFTTSPRQLRYGIE